MIEVGSILVRPSVLPIKAVATSTALPARGLLQQQRMSAGATPYVPYHTTARLEARP